MTTMREHLSDYLAQRRALGYKMVTAEGILKGFCDWLDENQSPSTFTIKDVLRWARTPAGTTSLRWSRKLGALRPFAAFVHAIVPDVPVIPTRLMPDPPGGSRRAPFIYSQDDLDRLIASCPALYREIRVAVTMQTVIALMASTGIRTGEALTLTVGSINDRGHVLRVHADKTDSDRLIPLHPTTTAGLLAFIDHPARRRYAKRDDPSDPIFITNRGTAYRTGVIDAHFRRLTTAIGLGIPGAPPPRLYDLRHTFATGHMTAAYTNDTNPQRTLTLLSTWLGHNDPTDTYWYLSATPILMAAAADRLDPITHSKDDHDYALDRSATVLHGLRPQPARPFRQHRRRLP